MVKVIEKVAAGSTPDNSKYVALVQKGAELAHELLLRQRALELAGMRVNAVQAGIGRAQELVAATQAAIRNAQLKLDLLLGFAFRAQRSVEIYTLKSEAANLFLDAGYISPDVESDYREDRINDAQRIAAYSDSWSHLLQPIQMQADYMSYFDQDGISSDIRRLSFKDTGLLQSFRTSHTSSFAVDRQTCHRSGPTPGRWESFWRSSVQRRPVPSSPARCSTATATRRCVRTDRWTTRSWRRAQPRYLHGSRQWTSAAW